MAQETTLQALGLLLAKHNVKQTPEGRFCGLVVNMRWAQMFVSEPAEERKSMEIRTFPVKFLGPGDRICLVATCDGQPRRACAILEFEHCISLSTASFPKYFPLHRVTAADLESVLSSSNQDGKGLYGWQFNLVHILPDCPVVPNTRGRIWIYFSCDPDQPGVTFVCDCICMCLPCLCTCSNII